MKTKKPDPGPARILTYEEMYAAAWRKRNAKEGWLPRAPASVLYAIASPEEKAKKRPKNNPAFLAAQQARHADRKTRAAEAHAAGMSARDIADELGVTPEQVKRYLRAK